MGELGELIGDAAKALQAGLKISCRGWDRAHRTTVRKT